MSELVSTVIQPAVEMQGNQRVISHLCELCGGGTLAALTAAMNNNIKVLKYTYIHIDPAAFYLAETIVHRFLMTKPHLLSSGALVGWSSLPQDVHKLSAKSFVNLPPVTLMSITPPCTPFSVAGNRAGWDSKASSVFIKCVNLARDLYNAQHGKLTWVIENVPGSVSFTAIREALGDPIMLNATNLGSSAMRGTAIWTNAAQLRYLAQHYEGTSRRNTSPTITDLLHKLQMPLWTAPNPNQHYFPKFLSRPGSWNFRISKNGTPGRGMLLFKGKPMEPCAEIREAAMGMPVGHTHCEGLDAAQRLRLLGACMDHNVATWLLDKLAKYSTSDKPITLAEEQAAMRTAAQAPTDIKNKALLTQDDHTALPDACDYPADHFPDIWANDSGCTKHIVSARSDYWGKTYRLLNPPRMVYGLMKLAIGVGDVRVCIKTDNGERNAIIKNVWHVPGLSDSGAGVTRLFSQRAAQLGSPASPLFVSSSDDSYMQYGSLRVHSTLYPIRDCTLCTLAFSEMSSHAHPYALLQEGMMPTP